MARGRYTYAAVLAICPNRPEPWLACAWAGGCGACAFAGGRATVLAERLPVEGCGGATAGLAGAATGRRAGGAEPRD